MSDTPTANLRLGARGSLLSRMQSQWVADALEKAHPGLRVELILIKTTGDRITDRPLHDAGGKGLFTKEIEQALLAGEVDLAVHSYKDVPVTMPLVEQADLVIAAVPPREDPRDVLAVAVAAAIAGGPGPESSPTPAPTLRDLPPGGRVGTGSLRRRAQVLALRPDLAVLPIRGNVDTRLKKMRGGEYDAVILAAAGLRRSALFDAAEMTPIDAADMLPAAGQGALALQCRRDDARTRQLLAALHSPPDATCVDLERAVVAALEGDCHSPIAALATLDGAGTLTLTAAVAARGGEPPLLRARQSGPLAQAPALLRQVVDALKAQGAMSLLRGDSGGGGGGDDGATRRMP
jgi:hydroxymethylbilane synthase